MKLNILIIPIQDTDSYLKVDLRDYVFRVYTPQNNSIFKYYTFYIYISPSQILFCGNHNAQHVSFDEVILIDIENNLAIQKTPLPKRIGCAGICKFKEKIYSFGGINSGGDCYFTDLNFTIWTSITKLPVPAYGISLYKKIDTIILTGYEHIDIYSYDTTADKFSIYLRYNKPNNHEFLFKHNDKEYILTTNEILIKGINETDWRALAINLFIILIVSS